MSLSRRESLVQLARVHDALVICDDVYDFLQWPASGRGWGPISIDRPPEMRLPRLSDIDRNLGETQDDPNKFGHVVSNGSFSKLIGPGIRTGWVDAAPAFSYGLSCTGSSRSGGAPSQMSAAIVYELLRQGDLSQHIETVVRPGLQRRHRLINGAIHEHLSHLGVSVLTENLTGSGVYGGYFVWLSLPTDITAKDVVATAQKEENLIVGSGHLFEVHGDERSATFPDKIRLSFSWEPESAVVEGVRRLANVIASLKARG
jgi:DNA-binding transcriptional MocR family regulator